MGQSKRVAQFVDTGQIYDGISEERIQPRPLSDIWAKTIGIWMHEHVGSEPPLHHSSSHLTV